VHDNGEKNDGVYWNDIMGSNSFDFIPREESINLPSESQSAKKNSVNYDLR